MKKLQRIVYLDLLRGYLLFAIIVDHLQRRPNLFEIITGRGNQWASAAEGFFFISGLMLGYVRGNQMESKGQGYVIGKIALRTVHLYVISVLLTLLFSWWAMHTYMLPGNNIAPEILKFKPETIYKILTLQYFYGWTSFLGYYVFFLALSIPALILLRRKLWPIVLLLSLCLYLYSEKSFFLNWQILFIVGMILGHYYRPIERYFTSLPLKLKKNSTWFIVLCAATTYLLSLFYNSNSDDLVRYLGNQLLIPFGQNFLLSTQIYIQHYHDVIREPLFNRDSLTWPRLFFFSLWFSGLMILFRTYENPLQKYCGWLLSTYGRASLLTFVIHGIVIFWLNYTFPVSSQFVIINGLVTIATLISILVLVILCRHLYRMSTSKLVTLHEHKKITHSSRK